MWPRRFDDRFEWFCCCSRFRRISRVRLIRMCVHCDVRTCEKRKERRVRINDKPKISNVFLSLFFHRSPHSTAAASAAPKTVKIQQQKKNIIINYLSGLALLCVCVPVSYTWHLMLYIHSSKRFLWCGNMCITTVFFSLSSLTRVLECVELSAYRALSILKTRSVSTVCRSFFIPSFR